MTSATIEMGADDASMQLDELASNLASVMSENEMLTKLLSTDPSMTGMVKLIKQQEREIDSLRERNAGLMEEKNEAIRASKAAIKKATASIKKLVPA